MRVVVTGATGFLGQRLIEHLELNGHEVIGVAGPSGFKGRDEASPSQLWALESPLVDVATKVALFQPEFILHCANHYVFHHRLSDIELMIDANLRFGLLLLESVAGTPTHFINFSSFFQTFDEKTLQPNSLYAILKQSFSDVVAWYSSTSLLSTTDLVLFDVYGLGDLRDRIVPRLFAAARTGNELTVNSPDALLNLCHVDDVISAVDLVLRTRTIGRWALRSRSLITVQELARMIESITGRCIVSDWGQKPPHADPSQNKIPTLPGWSPTIELRQRLEDYWNSELRSE